MADFSKPETRALYEAEVRKRQALGMTREQAEMLVAVLMWDGPKPCDKPAVAPDVARK